MRLTKEYGDMLKSIVAQAKKMAATLPPTGQAGAMEVLTFLNLFGCEGYPAGRSNDFWIGPWLDGGGLPARQHQGVAIIPCFSDDVPPVVPAEAPGVLQGQLLFTDQVVILYNVNRWSLAELALVLLHEVRHARHRLGPKLGSLMPLDVSEDVHETSTWIFTLNVLVAWGGELWDAAVQREINWLYEHDIKSEQGHILIAPSHQYWPEFDQVFGPAANDEVRQARQRLAALQANMVYWPRLNTSLTAEQVCHTLVRYHYR